jgi:hypothetical protein
MPDRSGQGEQRQPGYCCERDDRHPECAVGNRGSNADRIQIGNAEPDQDRGDERPRITKPHQPFEKRAERPGEEDGLSPNVGRALRSEPATDGPKRKLNPDAVTPRELVVWLYLTKKLAGEELPNTARWPEELKDCLFWLEDPEQPAKLEPDWMARMRRRSTAPAQQPQAKPARPSTTALVPSPRPPPRR